MKTKFRTYFLTGLIALLPLAVVVLVLTYLYRFVFGIIGWIPSFNLPYNLGFIINLIFLIILIFLVGVVTTEMFKGYYKNIDGFFLRLPVIGKFYGSIRQVTDALYGNKKGAFKKTVIVEYPRKKIYSLGFVIKDREMIAGKEMVAVLIPTSPTPLSGMLIYVTKDEIINTDISVEDALKLIISGGFVGRGEGSLGNKPFRKNLEGKA